ncbi:MAG: DUF885 domain-containing protein [Ignavibacteria bacterium]|nr:DUF885 domain-containing protein [Ignavibacteria bacterium]
MRPYARFIQFFVFFGALLSFAGCGLLSVLAPTDSDKFERVVREHFASRGQPGDGRVSSAERLRAASDSIRVVRAKITLNRLHAIDTTKLSIDARIDWLQFEASIKRTLIDTLLREAERIPGRYVTVGNLYWQMLGDRTLQGRDWDEILNTLNDVPAVVELGKRQLHKPPPLWVRLTINTIRRNEEFLSRKYPERVSAIAPDSLKHLLLSSGETARTALSGFRHFLHDSLKAGEESSWAVGSSYYNWLLKEVHFLPYDAEGMIAEGRRMHEETKQALAVLAKQVDESRAVPELLEAMKSRHPAGGTIAEAYRRESDRARALLVSKKLMTIPEPETLLFVPTPPALRETYAWAGYGGIQMREEVPVGRFFVTDVVPEMSDAEVREKLRAQNYGWITVIALHEGYPGHHLQSLYTRRQRSVVRSRLGSTYYGEGWALFAEAWMAREGFYKNADDSLAWLQMRLWRTARVIVDPSLHIGRMTYEQAVQFMVDEVGLEPSAAEAEVNRYTTWPTQAPSYIIGWLELEKLRREVKAKLGDRYEERDFVETILRMGSLPLQLLERAVMYHYESHLADGRK